MPVDQTLLELLRIAADSGNAVTPEVTLAIRERWEDLPKVLAAYAHLPMEHRVMAVTIFVEEYIKAGRPERWKFRACLYRVWDEAPIRKAAILAFGEVEGPEDVRRCLV